MPTPPPRAAAAALAAFAALGCARELSWAYDDRTLPERAEAFAARVREGDCQSGVGPPLAELQWHQGETAPSGPRLAPGRYSIEVDARRADCTVIGRGCATIVVPTDEPRALVTLSQISGPDACVGSACNTGVCGVGSGRCAADADCPCTTDRCVDGDCLPSQPATEIAAGQRHSCAITRSGWLYCWGHANVAQTGLGDMRTDFAPLRVGMADGWSAIETRIEVTCGILDGVVQCFGTNLEGQTGQPIGMNTTFVPTEVPRAPAAHLVDVGAGHVMMLSAEGDGLWAWGSNTIRQIDPAAPPALYEPGSRWGTWIDVTTGADVSCGIATTGELSCWGASQFGVLGNGMACEICTTPMPVTQPTPPRTWVDVEAGLDQVCALTSDHELFCWGKSTTIGLYDQLGATGTGSTDRNVPTLVSLPRVMQVAAGRHTCAIDADGALWCWGPNGSGQIGSGMTVELQPVAVRGGPWLRVSPGLDHTCAIDEVGAVWCWGSNAEQQLGLGDPADTSRAPDTGPRDTPVRVCVDSPRRGALP